MAPLKYLRIWILGILAMLAMLVSCVHRGPMAPETRATDPNARLVKGAIWFGSESGWRHTPWYRAEMDNIDWPRRVVLAGDGSVCLMDMGDVNEPEPHTYWACKG